MENKCVLVFLFLNVTFSCNGFRETESFDSESYEMPEACEGLSYCKDKGDHYPTDVVDMVVWDIIKYQKRARGETKTYESRFSDAPLNPECYTDEIIFKPLYYILDQNNVPRVVLQSENFDFWQQYDIRTCKKEGRVLETLNFKETALSRVNMTCQNIKAALDFQVLSLEPLGMELLSVEMPVFCKASYVLLNQTSRYH